METFYTFLLPTGYFAGIALSIAILEEFEDDIFYKFLFGALWPIVIIALIIYCLLYPIYRITKKIIGIIKLYQNDSKRKNNKQSKSNDC